MKLKMKRPYFSKMVIKESECVTEKENSNHRTSSRFLHLLILLIITLILVTIFMSTSLYIKEKSKTMPVQCDQVSV